MNLIHKVFGDYIFKIITISPRDQRVDVSDQAVVDIKMKKTKQSPKTGGDSYTV